MHHNKDKVISTFYSYDKGCWMFMCVCVCVCVCVNIIYASPLNKKIIQHDNIKSLFLPKTRRM
jgi:hypothetical protein